MHRPTALSRTSFASRWCMRCSRSVRWCCCWRGAGTGHPSLSRLRRDCTSSCWQVCCGSQSGAHQSIGHQTVRLPPQHHRVRRSLVAHSFFDRTPTGRILNRFSHDIDQIDALVSRVLSSEFEFAIRSLTAMTTCVWILPPIGARSTSNTACACLVSAYHADSS